MFGVVVLCLVIGLAGLPGGTAQRAVADTWDAKATTRLNTGHENGRIVRGAGSVTALRIGGSFVYGSCPSSNCYRCIFENPHGQRQVSPAKYDTLLTSEIACNTTTWGDIYDAAKVELMLQKNTGSASVPVWDTMTVTGITVGKYYLFLEEDIFRVEPTHINAYNNTVTVTGSGFWPTGREYRCITFEGLTSDGWQPTRTTGYTGLVGFTFTVINRTIGTCTLSSQFSSRSTKLSIMTLKEIINTLDTVVDQPSAGFNLMQPAVSQITKPSSGGADIVFWKGLDVTWFESWTYSSMLSGLREGGQTMTITGAGFKKFPLSSYFCEYTLNAATNSGCDGVVTPDTNVRVAAPATVVDSLTLTCETPAWTSSLPRATTILKVRADTQYQGRLVIENNLQDTSFDFVTKPVWSPDTPAEGTVYMEGVDCAALNLTFKASQGLSSLRLTLDYTPLRPQASQDFLTWSNGVPQLSQVLYKTDDLQTSSFLDAAEVDDIRSFGYCLGPLSYTLSLPKTQLPEKQTEGHVVYSKSTQTYQRARDGLGIPDNSFQPSNLTLKTETKGSNVTGILFWNVSRGWEGYGYRLCVTARHAPVATSILVSENFNKRCVYVVVPKCQKCYGPTGRNSQKSPSYIPTI